MLPTTKGPRWARMAQEAGQSTPQLAEAPTGWPRSAPPAWAGALGSPGRGPCSPFLVPGHGRLQGAPGSCLGLREAQEDRGSKAAAPARSGPTTGGQALLWGPTRCPNLPRRLPGYCRDSPASTLQPLYLNSLLPSKQSVSPRCTAAGHRMHCATPSHIFGKKTSRRVGAAHSQVIWSGGIGQKLRSYHSSCRKPF